MELTILGLVTGISSEAATSTNRDRPYSHYLCRTRELAVFGQIERGHYVTLTCQISTRFIAAARSVGKGINNGCVCTFACIGTSTLGSACGGVLQLTVLQVSRDADAPERRTAVLDANEVDATAEDSGIGDVTAQSRRGEGALLSKRARLHVLFRGLFDGHVLVGRVDGGGHGRVGVLGRHHGECGSKGGGGDSDLHYFYDGGWQKEQQGEKGQISEARRNETAIACPSLRRQTHCIRI